MTPKWNTSIRVIDLPRFVDDRGILTEIARSSFAPNGMRPGSKGEYLEEHVSSETHAVVSRFGQVYAVTSFQPGTVRGFHRHKNLTDFFFMGLGSAKFVFVEAELEAADRAIDTVVLSSLQPRLIVVPPLVWHGWMALEPMTTLISIASDPYNREHPDEERISYDEFGKSLWDVKFK